MNAEENEIAATDNLDDCTTLIVSGNTVDDIVWGEIGDLISVVDNLTSRTCKEGNLEYFYVTV